MWVAVGCLVALASVALVLAVLVFAHTPRPKPLLPTSASAPTPTATGAPQIPSLSSQIAQIEAARRQGVPRSAWIAATEPDLTAWLSQEMAGQGAQVKQVTFEGNNAVIFGTYLLAGRPVDVAVTLLPSAQNGRLSIEVQEGHVGLLPMPPGMKIAMQRQLDKAMDQAFAANPDVRVDSVEVRDRTLIIAGSIGGR
jgi:hypothetical protein